MVPRQSLRTSMIGDGEIEVMEVRDTQTQPKEGEDDDEEKANDANRQNCGGV